MTRSDPTPSPAAAPDTDTAPVSAAAPKGPIEEGLRVTLPGDAAPAERWLWRGLLLVLCLLAYTPSLSGKFLWDDNRHAAAPAYMRDLTGLEAIWTKVGLPNGGTPQYYPLTHTTFWLEYQLWGRNALGYRAFNILLHAGGAVVLWELLRRLRTPGAFLAAVIFALHPLMVESVAWTTERKNTLSLLLALTSLLLYAMFAGLTEDRDAPPVLETSSASPPAPDWALYGWAAVAFVGAMLSKTMAASVPVLILLMLWWKHRLTPRHLGLVAPMFAVAVGLGLMTGYIEHQYVIRPAGTAAVDSFGGWLSAKLSGTLSSGPEFDIPFSRRLMMAGLVPWFYAYKLFAPVDLMFFYPRWDLVNAPALWWAGLGGVLAVLAALGLLAARGTRWPLAVALGYLVALFPAMGFVDVYPFRYSYVADHFSYHAVWILIAVVAAGLAVGAKRLGLARDPRAALAAGTLLALLLGGRTYVHARTFWDNYELFSHTFAQNPTSWAASMNLAREYVDMAGVADSAERRYRAARDADGVQAAAKEKAEFLTEARRLLNITLELRPNHSWAHFWLGRIAVMENNADLALDMYLKSARIREENNAERDGSYAPTYAAIGALYQAKGQTDNAIAAFEQSIAAENPPLQPKQGFVRLEMLKLKLEKLRQQDRLARQSAAARTTTSPSTPPSNPLSTLPSGPTREEVTALVALAREVTELLPKNEDGWMLAGDLMSYLGDTREALVAYRQVATDLNPQNVSAMVKFGKTMAEGGDIVGARVAFQEALRLDPNREDAKRFLSLLDEAVKKAQTQAATRAATQPATRTTTAPAPAAP